jgi:tryptophan halogenase
MFKGKINIVEKNVSAENVDADYVMDCSGKPSNYDDFNLTESIPVNSVHVTPCYWDHARFKHTLTIARPYGWVFGIPLQNRCSIGYMYNNNINTLEEIKEDVKQVFADYNLIPSDDCNSFSFKNYYRKENFTDRIAYNGNASFFLEPLEATSISLMTVICKMASDNWFKKTYSPHYNSEYTDYLQEIETVIMLHYFSGSVFKTKFWDFAQERGEQIIRRASNSPKFREFVNESLLDNNYLMRKSGDYGTWGKVSFKQNLENLNLYQKIASLKV